MNKRLLLFYLTIIFTHQFLSGNSDVNNLAQALKNLAEAPTKPTTQSLPSLEHTDIADIPFVTHMLVIFCETWEKPGGEVISRSIMRTLTSQVPFLATEQQLWVVSKSKTKDWLHGYRYFKVPESNQFLLCIPEKMVTSAIDPIADPLMEKAATYVPEKITTAEKETGLLIEHCEEITSKLLTEKSYALKKSYQLGSESLGSELVKILQVLFVPKEAYTQTTIPRWLLIFDGHGTWCDAYDRKTVLKKHLFIKKYGSICGMDAENFAKIIEFLDKKLTIAHIHLMTCFGGGINLGNLLQDVETGVLPPYLFIITTNTLMGDTCVLLYEKLDFFMFFKTLKAIVIKDPQLLLQSREIWESDNPKEIFNSAFEALYREIPVALSYVTEDNRTYVPGIKPIGANYFVEVQLPNGRPIQRIDATTIKTYRNKTVEIPDGTTVLLYTNTIPFTLRIGKDVSILSAIPDSTCHVIDHIEKITYDDRGYYQDTIVNIADSGMSESINKVFHIKKWSTPDGVREVKIAIGKDAFEMVGRPYIVNQSEPGEKLGKQLVKNTNDQIDYLKKLANAQAPYRFLKDADIETLPWD